MVEYLPDITLKGGKGLFLRSFENGLGLKEELRRRKWRRGRGEGGHPQKNDFFEWFICIIRVER